MQPDKTTQASESIDDNQAEADPSRSRRGFLKKAATTGILGMSGLTAAVATSEPARAGPAGWDYGPFWMSGGDRRRFGDALAHVNHTGEIRIDGIADYSQYRLMVPGGRGDKGISDRNKDLRAAGNDGWGGNAGNVENGDDLHYNGKAQAFGEVRDRVRGNGEPEHGLYDDYFFEDRVICKVQSGRIRVFINDTLA